MSSKNKRIVEKLLVLDKKDLEDLTDEDFRWMLSEIQHLSIQVNLLQTVVDNWKFMHGNVKKDRDELRKERDACKIKITN